jgi:hypothetical protein
MNVNFISILVIIFFTIPPVFGITFEPTESNQSTCEQNTSLPDNNSTGNWGIDHFQFYWSDQVFRFASYLDQKLSLFGDEDNTSILDTNTIQQLTDHSDIINIPTHYSIANINQKNAKETYLTSIWIDEFYKDENYLDTMNRSYVLVHGGYEYNKRGDSSLFYNVNARIKLPKTEDKLQLYIGEITQDSTNLSNTKKSSDNTGIGLKYYMPTLFEHLYTNASVGVSSINNPYAKARIEYPLFYGNWLFKPIQNFKFSLKNEFEEWTDLYFDRKLSDSEMVRLLLQRSTKSGVRGMDYLAQFSYINTRKNGIGFNHYIAISGRIKDLTGTVYPNGLTPQEGIYEYSAGTIWRQKVLRDYLFYQIQPIITFHEQYNFKPDYILRFSLDFYFGNNR